ncbi:hypothetical protein LMG919_13250 [Xanthomonas vesicatoria]|nr:hypothetical protein LMG919_13250 [Xanthomonas vesicatoria]
MGVGLGSDAHHQSGDLAGVPLHAFGQLQHRNAVAAHQVAALAHAVRDRQAMAQESICQAFAASHAGVVTGRHAAGGDQQLRGLGDGIVLVAGLRTQTDELGSDGGGRRRRQGGLRLGDQAGKYSGNVPTIQVNVQCTKSL